MPLKAVGTWMRGGLAAPHLAAMLCNVVFFCQSSRATSHTCGERIAGRLALIFLARGIKRAFGRPRVYHGKSSAQSSPPLSLLLVSLVIHYVLPCRRHATSAACAESGANWRSTYAHEHQRTAGFVWTSFRACSRRSEHHRAEEGGCSFSTRGYW